MPASLTSWHKLCGCGGMVDTLVLGTSAARRAGSNPVTRTMKLLGRFELTETDKTLGVIVCFLALLVVSLGVLLYSLGDFTWGIDLVHMGLGWWFGATMVWLTEKWLNLRG